MNIFTVAYGNQAHNGIHIGKNLKNGRPVRLKNNQSTTEIIGASGTGKTNLMSHSALESITRNNSAVVILDPHTDLVRDIALQCPPEQAHRLIYFDPYTQFRQGKAMLGFNPFQVKDMAAEYEEKAQAMMNVFAHSWYGGFHNA